VIGAGGAQPALDRRDLRLEVVDQVGAGIDRAAPGVRQLEALQQLAAGETEQV
jgi:hypothetical protein